MGIVHGIAVFRVIIWGMKIHNYQLFWCEGHGYGVEGGPCQVDRVRLRVLQVLQAQSKVTSSLIIWNWHFRIILAKMILLRKHLLLRDCTLPCHVAPMCSQKISGGHLASLIFIGRISNDFPIVCGGWRRGTWTSCGVISIIIPAWAQADSNFQFSSFFNRLLGWKDLTGTVHWTEISDCIAYGI